LSSEQSLGGNLRALFLYSLILAWQDMRTNTQTNKLQSVKPCVPVWQSFSSMRKEEIVFTCLWIMHNCLTHSHLLQDTSTPASTHVVCPLQFYTSGKSAHVMTNAKYFHGQGTLHGILGDD
jgi:hypothetical protein